MMKVCLALVVAVAVASDTEAPVISLNLDHVKRYGSVTKYAAGSHYIKAASAKLGGAFKNHAKSVSTGPKGGMDGGVPASKVPTDQAYTSECNLKQWDYSIKSPNTKDACRLPSVTAYDHQAGSLTHKIEATVTQYIEGAAGQQPKFHGNKGAQFKYETDGSNKPSKKFVSKVSNERGEYIFQFNVEDNNNNKAETVVYALLVRDEMKPWIDPNYAGNFRGDHNSLYNQKVERSALAAAGWEVPNAALHFHDNADEAGVTDVKVALDESFPKNNCFQGQIGFTVADHASIFGKDNSDNTFKKTVTFKTVDRVKPIEVGLTPALVEKHHIKANVDIVASGKSIECDYTDQFGIKDIKGQHASAFEDDGCQCELTPMKKNWGPKKALQKLAYGAGSCQWSYKSSVSGGKYVTPAGHKTTCNGNHNMCYGKVFKISYTSRDSSNNVYKASRSYEVVDTKIPTLEYKGRKNAHQAANADVMNFKSGDNFQNYAGHCSPGSRLKKGDNTGRCYDKNGNVVAKQYNAENDGKKNAKLFPNNKEAQDRVSVGNGKQETFRNLWVQSTEYSHIIQHSAGSLNDANALKALAENYQCTDTCDENPKKTAKWFDITGLPEKDHCKDYALAGGTDMNAGDSVFAGGKLQKALEKYRNSYNHTDAPKIASTHYSLERTGKFIMVYSCEDDAGHKTSADCRTVINEDSTKPVMRLMEDVKSAEHRIFNDGGFKYATSEWGVEKVWRSAGDGPYVDQGAECSDQVDGFMSQKIEVSGDIVNMAVPGTYFITFNCEDTAGNMADPLKRTVFVHDDECPTCMLNAGPGGKTQKVVHEASFPFNLANYGATCNDNVAGEGLLVSITGKVDVEKVGTYVLTYTTSDGENDNTGLSSFMNPDNHGQTKGKHAQNDDHRCNRCSLTADGKKAPFDKKNGFCGQPYRTVYVEDRLAPVIMLHAPALMAESSSNGWLALALASAAAGVALLGFSSRKAPATSVPV
jgi:hypothetical protein